MNFEVNYIRQKLLLAGLEALSHDRGMTGTDIADQIEAYLGLDHGVERESDERAELESEYFDELEDMISQLTGLDV